VDGLKRLKAGPIINSYRGLRVVHSLNFSLENGVPPRDILCRRVRVAEYYRIRSVFLFPYVNVYQLC
jgi:hypothetical protein